MLAFSQLRIRDEAIRYLEDLFSFLIAAPAAPLREGRTRGEQAAAYLDDLGRYGRCGEFDFQWLRDDPLFAGTLERYRGQLQAGGPISSSSHPGAP